MIGLDIKKVPEYIRVQEKEDLMTYTMSTKEYMDYSKGSQVLIWFLDLSSPFICLWSISPYSGNSKRYDFMLILVHRTQKT